MKWILNNPEPNTDTVHPELRDLWLEAAQACLDQPVGTGVFSVYLSGRVKAELANAPQGQGIFITGLEDDQNSPERPAHTRGWREIHINELAADFPKWAEKLGMALIAAKTNICIAPVPLFRFPSGETMTVYPNVAGRS